MSYLNITADLTAEGRKKVKVGQLLIFNFEGSPVYLEVMRKSAGQVFARRRKPELIMTPEEADKTVTIVPKK